MQTLNAIYSGQLRCEAVHNQSGTIIQTDAPTDNHGKGERFSPTDLVAAALGTCILTTMALAAEKLDCNLDGTHLTVNKVMFSDPRRIGRLVVNITFPVLNVPESVHEKLQQAALHCPVAKSLHPDLHQDITFHYTGDTIFPAL